MLELGIYGSRDLMNLQIFDAATSTPLMHFKLANTVEDAGAGSTSYARGRGVRQLAFSNEVEKTLTVTSQLFSLQQMGLMYGKTIVEGAKDIFRSEVLEVEDGGTITLTRTPINDDIAVIAYNNGLLKRLPQTITNVTGNTVTLDLNANGIESVAVGDEVEVYYQYNVARAFTLRIPALSNSPYVRIVGDTLWADKNSGALVPVQQVYYRARMDQEATLAFSAEGDPGDFAMTFQILPKTIKGEEVLSDIIVYDDPILSKGYIDVEYDGQEPVKADI